MAVWTGDALDPTVFSLPQVDMADVGTSKNKLILLNFIVNIKNKKTVFCKC